jgi:hypothetical protein
LKAATKRSKFEIITSSIERGEDEASSSSCVVSKKNFCGRGQGQRNNIRTRDQNHTNTLTGVFAQGEFRPEPLANCVAQSADTAHRVKEKYLLYQPMNIAFGRVHPSGPEFQQQRQIFASMSSAVKALNRIRKSAYTSDKE